MAGVSTLVGFGAAATRVLCSSLLSHHGCADAAAVLPVVETHEANSGGLLLDVLTCRVIRSLYFGGPENASPSTHHIIKFLDCCCSFSIPAQAREAGGDELDDLVSAPRMVLQQYVEKWFPEDPADLARMSNKALKKLLLDVSGRALSGCGEGNEGHRGGGGVLTHWIGGGGGSGGGDTLDTT